MENKNNFIVVSYALYDTTKEGDGNEVLIEKTQDGRPFIFVSGMNAALPAFEEQLVNLEKGAEFDFELTPDKAYGDHYDERIIELDKQIFTIDGKFDGEHVQVGAIIPLQNEDGNRFLGHVLEIGDEKVKVDLNHPLAGKKLNFCGEVLENREATVEEVAQMAKILGGDAEGGCSGSCENCKGDCNKDGEKDCNCEGGCNCEK